MQPTLIRVRSPHFGFLLNYSPTLSLLATIEQMIPGENFFPRLLQLPLFQGIGRGDFWEIAELIRIAFHRLEAGKVLVRAGDPCRSLLFVMKGTLCAQRADDRHRYTFHEYLNSPMVVQPECLFGLATQYTRTFTVAEDIQYFEIKKEDVRDVLFNYETFRINYLNLLSRYAQYATHRMWKCPSEDVAGRFNQFILARAMHPAGRKELHIRMEDLAEELLTTRLRVSEHLRQMQSEGLLISQRGRILIPALERLVNQ